MKRKSKIQLNETKRHGRYAGDRKACRFDPKSKGRRAIRPGGFKTIWS